MRRLERCRSGSRTRRNQLGRDCGTRGPAFFQFLLHLLFRAVVLPILVAIPERDGESETGRSPHAQGSERERGGEIQGHGQNRGAHDICSGQIQVMDEDVADDASDQAFHGNYAQPAGVSWHKTEQRGNKHQQPDCAQRLGHGRYYFARTKPARAQSTQEDGNQKGTDAEALQHQIGNDRAHQADPIAGGAGTGQDRGAIEGWIKRRIRSQCQKKQQSRDTEQESDQLVEPAVVRGRENLRKILHGACLALSR